MGREASASLASFQAVGLWLWKSLRTDNQSPTSRPPAQTYLRKRKMARGGSTPWVSGTLGSRCGPSSSSSPGCNFSASSKMNKVCWQRRRVSCICHRNSSCTGHRELRPRRSMGSCFLRAEEHRSWAPPPITIKPQPRLGPHLVLSFPGDSRVPALGIPTWDEDVLGSREKPLPSPLAGNKHQPGALSRT